MDRRDYGHRGDYHGGHFGGGYVNHQNQYPGPHGMTMGGGSYMGGPPKGYMPVYGNQGGQGGVHSPNLGPVSVWIGKISSVVTDRPIRAILDLIGSVSGWRRHTDNKTGQPKTFGFADFFSPRSAILAKSILNDLLLGDSSLSVKIDEKNQKIIDDWLLQHARDAPTDADEKNLKLKILQSINDLHSTLQLPLHPLVSDTASVAPSNTENNAATSTTEAGADVLSANSVPSDISAPASSTLHSTAGGAGKVDISSIKKVAATKTRRDEEKQRDFEKKLEMMEEAREREQRRVEANEKQYRLIERELELGQIERVAGLERRKKNEEEAQRLRIADLALEDTQTWDSAHAEELENALHARVMSTDYLKARAREREQDELDREAEDAELRAEIRRAEERHKEQVRLQQEEQAMRMKAEAAKRSSASTAQSSDSPSSQTGRNSKEKKRIHDSLSTDSPNSKVAKISESQSSPHTIILGNMPSTSHPTVNQEAPNPHEAPSLALLTSKIPSDTASLFVAPIRWDLAEKHNLLELKIRPWVTKKIVEFLEIEEPTMIQFICTHIKEHKPPKELIAQLKSVLDDDAEVFVITLWRMLVLESLKMESAED